MSIQLRPYQGDLKGRIYGRWAEMGVDAAGVPKQLYRNVMAVMGTGMGKCLAKGTPVLMFNGEITPVEDIAVGDLLMGPDSKPRRVLSLARGQEMMYRVTPVKGDSYVVNESHILSLKRTGDDRREKGGIVNISVRDYIQKSATFKHLHKGWRSPANWDRKIYRAELPPYLLGLWLGDGSQDGADITTADSEIAEYLHRFALSTDQYVSVAPLPDNAASVLRICGYGRHHNTTRRALRDLNLINNKHVPLIYRTGDEQQRLELLAGMLDSDGYLANGTCYDVVFKLKELADGLAFVARSLGFACYVKPCRKRCHNNGVVGDYFRLSISGDVSRIPTRLARHRPEPRRQKKDVLVTGISVEAIGVDDYYGFTIDGDHLFMLGDFTVTHNTALFSSIIGDMARGNPGRPVVAIAHRQELVAQMSLALAREGLRHMVIAPENVRRSIRKLHRIYFNADFLDPESQIVAAGVDTLIRREFDWYDQACCFVIDEAHHTLRDNKWGQAAKLFPNALGLGVTASPIRGDGKGLGSGEANDGIFDVMEEGPAMGWAISQGYLTNYRVLSIPSDVDYSEVAIGSDGDLNQSQLRKAVHKSSKIVGDVVEHYLKHAAGKLGIAFCVDVQESQKLADRFNEMGIPAACLSAQTSDEERARVMVEFKERKVMVLCNCDILGEGVDVPAVEVVMMVRKTLSLSLFLQQFGRALRPSPGKEFALILDHVGNVLFHRYPDVPRHWSLARPDRRSRKKADDDDIESLQVCVHCTGTFEKFLTHCPYCGKEVLPIPRPSIKQVAGDLIMLDPDMFGDLQRQIEEAGRFIPPPSAAGPAAHAGALNRYREKRSAQDELKNVMAWYGGYRKALGLSDREAQRSFYLHFGVDVMTAQTLNRAETEELRLKIESVLHSANVPFTPLQEEAC